MNCTKCNAPIPENSLFCPECGAKVEAAPAPAAVAFCSNCGAAMAANDMFCENCGAKAGATPVAPAPAVSEEAAPVAEVPAESAVAAAPAAETAPGIFCENCGAALESGSLFCENCGAKTAAAPVKAAAPKKNPIGDFFKKIPPKYLKLGLIGLAALIVIIVAVCIIVNVTAKQDYTLYLKDGELIYSQLPEAKDPMEVTSSFGVNVSNSYYANLVTYNMAHMVSLSEDGKTLFYPDKASTGSYGEFYEYSLYYRDITDSKGEATRISNSVTSHRVNTKGNIVTYLKSGALYQYDMKESTKIDTGVSEYYVTADGKTILYCTYDGNLYLVKNMGDAEKVASDIYYIAYCNDSLDAYLYIKDDKIYSGDGNGDHKKLVNDFDNLLYANSVDSFYYTDQEEIMVSYWDLIEDDMEGKEFHNYDLEYVRQYLKDAQISFTFDTLYYFNGLEDTVISENYIELYGISSNGTIAYIAGTAELPKVKFSEVLEAHYDSYYYYDEVVNSLIQDVMGAETLTFASKGVTSHLENLEVSSVFFSSDGKTVYLGANLDFEGNYATYEMDLYKADIVDGKIGEATLFDEGISSSCVYICGGKLIYFKDEDENYDIGELHIDGKMVANNVEFSSLIYYADTDAFAFLGDYNTKKNYGTLMEYKDGKVTEIHEEVASAEYTACGNLAFLYDYNDNRGEGELWIYEGGKARHVDDDVNAILPIY